MFLALIILVFLSQFYVPAVKCEALKSKLNPINFGNRSFSYQDIAFSPFISATPKFYILQSEQLRSQTSPKIQTDIALYKNGTSKKPVNEFSKRNAPARVPRVYSKDYGHSSHYRVKGSRDSSKKSFYVNLLQKLLRPGTSRSKRNKYDSPVQISSPSSGPMEAAGGWGWGWTSGHGHGHGHGISLLDLLLTGLSLLSLGGFLLNLLLNLLNMFGLGMFTTTSTYPVTTTQTGTSTGTGGGGGGVITTTSTGGGTLPAALSGIGSGWGITGRNIDSIAGNGWGKGGKGGKGGTQALLKGRIKIGGAKGGWPSTTVPPVTIIPTVPVDPTLTGLPIDPTLTGTGGGGVTGLAAAVSALTSGRIKRRKREIFQPYVNPPTALNTFAKSILNSIDAAVNKYSCIEKIFCENNKQARVIGQWLDYFMPVYSFSLSYYGHRMGAHQSLLDHISAIALGIAETNCHVQFPQCTELVHTIPNDATQNNTVVSNTSKMS